MSALTDAERAAVRENSNLVIADHGCPIAAYIPLGENIMSFGFSNGEVNPETVREIADKLTACAVSVNRLAEMRGDDDSDMPGTLENAVYAVGFLLNWATAMRQAATTPYLSGAHRHV